MQQQKIEKKILAHMLKNLNETDTVIDNGIKEEFFWYKVPHSNKPLYAGLFNMIIETRIRNGSLLTKEILQDKLASRLTNKGIQDADKQQAMLVAFYDEVTMEEVIDGELSYLIQKIKENWNAQIMTKVSGEMQKLKKEADNTNSDETWTYVGQNLIKYLDESLVSTTRGARIKTRDLMRDTDVMIAEVKERIENPERYKGIYIGLPPIDDITNGFRAGQLVVFIGQVGSGKTTLLTNLAYNSCDKFSKNILFFSLEMLEWMMISKFNARDMSIDYGRFRDGTLNKEEQKIVFNRLEARKNAKAGFWHKEMTGSCTVADIEREVRLMFMQEKIDVVFIDYLGIVDPSPQFGSQRWEQLGRASEKLRDISKEYEVPIVTAVQANRNTIKKVRDEVKAGSPADLTFGVESVAESISIANTADIIFGIYTDFDENKMWIHQVKNREGNVKPFSVSVQAAMSYIGYDAHSSALQFLSSDDMVLDSDEEKTYDESVDIVAELEKLENNDSLDAIDDLDNLDDLDIDNNPDEDDISFEDLDELDNLS